MTAAERGHKVGLVEHALKMPSQRPHTVQRSRSTKAWRRQSFLRPGAPVVVPPGIPLIYDARLALARLWQVYRRIIQAPTLPDGSPNLENVNRHAGFPAAPAPLLCDVTTNKGDSCIVDVFDLRVAYDSKRNRFIFAGAYRNQREPNS